MSPSSARNQYVKDAVATVAPARLLVMLYDRLALDLVRAREALEQHRLETVHESLVHAQEIVTELHVALDPQQWPAATSLGEVYEFLNDLLVKANVRKDPILITDCMDIVEPLRDAWHQAAGLGEARPLSAA